jgi:hypothetical protein
MKNAIVLFITLVSQLSLASPLTNGSYKGKGLWNSPTGQKGTYQNSTLINGNLIQARYHLTDGSTRDWNFTIRPTCSNFFDVLADAQKVGAGYCLDKAPVCHYELTVKQLKLEETLVQEGTKLYRYGSKADAQDRILWQESLDKE